MPKNENSVGFICQILRYLQVSYSLVVLSHSGLKNYPVVSFNFSSEQLLAEVMFPVESRERDQKCHQWNGNSVVRRRRKKKDRSSCSTDTPSLIFLAWNKSQRRWGKKKHQQKQINAKQRGTRGTSSLLLQLCKEFTALITFRITCQSLSLSCSISPAFYNQTGQLLSF